ncbi:Uncharacterised protein [Chlamydia abortus]|nr:Uncharacterised protein [Chlamydia abortus]
MCLIYNYRKIDAAKQPSSEKDGSSEKKDPPQKNLRMGHFLGFNENREAD